MYIGDGMEALLKIIENNNDCAKNKIFNIGNAAENISIRQLAEMLICLIKQYPKYAELAEKTKLVDVSAEAYYGKGYQDVTLRVHSLKRIEKELGWQPTTNMEEGLKKTLDFYLA